MKNYEQLIHTFVRAQIFRITRIAFNYKQSEMASILDISKSNISLMENGKRNISFDIIEKYLEKFKIKQEDFKDTENKIFSLLLNNDNMLEIAKLVYEMLLKSYNKAVTCFE